MQTLRVVLVLLLAPVSLAWADWKQDFKQCETETNPDRALLYCSSAIDSGKLSGQQLAIAHYRRGTAYISKHEVNKAIQDYDRAIALNPSYADAFYSRGKAYLQVPSGPLTKHTDVEGNIVVNLGEIDPRAIQDFSQVIRLRPNDVQAFISRAQAYAGMGDHGRAIEDWSQVIRLKPDDLGAYYARAGAYEDKGDFDHAIQDWSQIILSRPGEADALQYRGDAYRAKGEHDRAIQDYDQVLRLEPDSNGGFYGRGEAYLAKGDYDRAIQDFGQAIRVYPENSAAFHGRGNAYLSKSEYDRAIQDFDRAIELGPTYKEFRDRGLAYHNKGQYDRAIQDFDEAIRLNPGDGESFSRRGAVRAAKGEYRAAIADFDVAIRLNPKDANSYFGRGTTRFDLGDFVAAQEDLVKVSSYPYGALWLYLARARAGQEARTGLAKDAAAMKLDVWPGPVVNLYLGKATTEVVMAASKHPDPRKEREARCEAYFYLGQQALLEGNKSEAKRLFRQTVETQVTTFIEFIGAQAELKRQ